MRREPGFYGDVPEGQYHADPDSLSVSGAKLLLKAPALFKYRQDNPETKGAFDLGHAAHTLVLGTGMETVVVQREITNRKGELLEVIEADDYKSDSARAHRDSIRAEGKTPLLRSELTQVEAMAERISEHEGAMRLLSGGEAEVSAYAIDEWSGVLRRCRYDYLRDDIGIDYKSAAGIAPGEFASAVAKWGYDMQAAWYLDVAELLGHPLSDFAFIAQAKEPPYLVEVYNLDADFIARGRTRNLAALERFKHCTETGVWPGYTGRPFTTLSPPRWARYDNEIQEISA